jgi:hypothetical protein
MNFDEIISLKAGDEKNKKLSEWYTNEVKISNWLNNPFKNSIIQYHDRVEYMRNGKYHRLNGPAIEYHGYNNQTTTDKFYYKGELFEDEKMWLAATRKELRKLKLKQLDK